MECIVIFGQPAVESMTFVQELPKIMDLALFHHHELIELVVRYIDFGTHPHLERSEATLLKDFKTYTENSTGDFPWLNHLKINPQELTAKKIAVKVKECIYGG